MESTCESSRGGQEGVVEGGGGGGAAAWERWERRRMILASNSPHRIGYVNLRRVPIQFVFITR